MKQADFESPKLRAMLYGDSGSGKTRLLGSAMYCTETCPILIMNARGQPQSLKGQDKKPLVLTVETMTDFNMVYDWFSRGQPVPKPIATNGYTPEVITGLPDPFNWIYEYLVKGEYERFNSFGVDSITQVQRIAMDAVQRTDEQWRPDYIPDKSTYGDWGKILSLLTKFADYHFDLPVHVFITALTRRDEVPSLGTTMYHPFLWGQAAYEVPSYAELVGRLVPLESLTTQMYTTLQGAYKGEFSGKEPPFNVLLTRGGRSFVAKWQGLTNPAPDAVVAPTVQKLIDILKEG